MTLNKRTKLGVTVAVAVLAGLNVPRATISVLLRLRDEAPAATGSGKSPIRGPAG